MAKTKKRIDKALRGKYGRDPDKGQVPFRTGKIRTLKDKERDRNSKAARRKKREQTEE